MEIIELLKGKNNCKCGKEHLCPIDQVIIETNGLEKLPSLVKKYKNILLVSDTNTYNACGKKVERLIKENDYLKCPDYKAIFTT